MVSLPSQMHFVSAVSILKKSPGVTALGLSASGSFLLLKQATPMSHVKDLTPAERGVPGLAGVTGGAAQMDCPVVASEVPRLCTHTLIIFLFLSVR